MLDADLAEELNRFCRAASYNFPVIMGKTAGIDNFYEGCFVVIVIIVVCLFVVGLLVGWFVVCLFVVGFLLLVCSLFVYCVVIVDVYVIVSCLHHAFCSPAISTSG